MSKRAPATPAVRVLRQSGYEYDEHVYDYDQFPGALGAAEYIGVDPHLTVKTVVFSTSDGDGVIVLMHGDLEVSQKELARILGVKSTAPATQAQADRWTGYQFGGTSPLGTRTRLPVLAESSIADLPIAYVNAGRKGFVIGIKTQELLDLCEARLVEVSA